MIRFFNLDTHGQASWAKAKPEFITVDANDNDFHLKVSSFSFPGFSTGCTTFLFLLNKSILLQNVPGEI